jgi:two-component system sensor histidine kinase AlgZ
LLRKASARTLLAATEMRPIIRQNPKPPGFPDLRNLGTLARILIGANLLIALAAAVRAPDWEALREEWLSSVAVAEPYLLLMLALLYALAPWLRGLAYGQGAAVVAAATLAVGIATDALMRRGLYLPTGELLRYLAGGLIVAGALLFYLQLRAKALSPALIEARLQALQARIRPHFLFNSITAVLSLVRTEPKRAEHALEDLADLFRVLMSDNRDLVPLCDEVDLCRQYLALEALRLGERLGVEWHLNSMPEDALIPPLVLQPLLENAVYHGIEPSSGPGVVSINIFAKEGLVHAILRNSYRVDGGRHHAGNKMALDNIRERLALHFDAEASLATRVNETTYEVHIQLPYRPVREPAAAAERARATLVAEHARGNAGGRG